MRVVAIDPAPAKESTMYSAERGLQSVPASEMRRTLESIEPPVLLCWDAPLTGPRDAADAGQTRGDFSQRRLDSFFMRKETRFKTPKGISVLPYAGCPHWAISRSVLGLPRLGPYDLAFDSLPFHLLPTADGAGDGVPISKAGGRWIVEIHPAVAAWLWCKPRIRRKAWSYKGASKDEALLTKMWNIILEQCDDALKSDLPTPSDDDEFDALVGYILGVKWLRGDDDVVLLGDRETGAMLLPRTGRLEKKWAEFRAEWAKETGSGVAE